MSSLVRDLHDVTAADRAAVGGKAASLGELLKLGVQVPTGFVITTKAYGTSVSGQLADEILASFDKLGAERVAVRSSAVAEDAAAASWAGQLDTYLNVKRAGLLQAIADCWQSIESDHAKAYAEKNNIQQSERAVAVVVQAMVDADTAGVLFTANPVTNDVSQCVIEAVYGLGELLVQGAVTPETFIVTKDTGAVAEHTPHRQRTKLAYKDGSNTELPLTDTETSAEILQSAQVSELVKQAQIIEQHYGKPQDIEWAFSGKKLFIVQSRAITTISTASSIEWATTVARRHTPLFLSLAVSGQDSKLIKQQTGLPISFTHIRRNGLAFQFDKQELAAARAVVHAAVEKDGLTFFETYADRCYQSCQKLLETAEKVAQTPLASSPEAAKKQLQPYFEAAVSHASHLLVMILVQFELEDFLNAFVGGKITDKKHSEKVVAALKMATERTHEVLNARGLLVLGQLVQEAVPDYKKWITTDPDELSFWNANEYAYIWDSIADFTGTYGWMGRMYYAGDPITLNDAIIRLQNVLRESCAKELEAIDAHRIRQLAERKQAIAALGNNKEAKLLAETVARYMYLRTYRLDVFFMAHERMIDMLQNVARLLGLADVQELIYLSWQEVTAGLEGKLSAQTLQAAANERRYGYEMLSMAGNTEWAASKVNTAANVTDTAVTSLKGVTANIGNRQGQVRLVLDDKAMQDMQPGEVLVTTMTTPSLMLAVEKAGAIVTDEGGMLCHAAIVSREFNIPCVIGTETATKSLRTGDTVKVEASKGLVSVLERA